MHTRTTELGLLALAFGWVDKSSGYPHLKGSTETKARSVETRFLENYVLPSRGAGLICCQIRCRPEVVFPEMPFLSSNFSSEMSGGSNIGR